MLELLAEVCLASAPETCAERLLPGAGACEPAAAAAWVAARPGLELRGARCGEAAGGLAVEEIAPGVFIHAADVALSSGENAGDIATLGFVIGDAAVAVIDAGGSRAVGEALYAAVRRKTDLPVRWVILTHMHPDHVYGAEVFAEAGAEVVGHARLPAALAARSGAYDAAIERDLGALEALSSDLVAPAVLVEATATLDLGGKSLELAAHPTAHTDNDLTVLDPASGVLFAGDLVFDRHLPTVDGSALGWIGLLDALTSQSPASRVVPGHGAPWLPWPDGAAATRGYLAAIVEEARAAVAAGESLGEAAPKIGLGLRDEWELFDEFNERNATAVYLEVEWE
jgi:quinoprotein relay system zinc metallohydrolase 2